MNVNKDTEQAFSVLKDKLVKLGDAEAIDIFDDIRLSYVKLDRAYFGLKQTNSNLKEKLEKGYKQLSW